MSSERSYWQRQAADKPLFPDLLWSRPEHRAAAGKLLIIGGNSFGFAAPAEAYGEAGKAGIGEARVILPDRLKTVVGTLLAAEYAKSNSSGSFSREALTPFMVDSQWADGVLLAGDLGRNSETAILLEKYVSSYSGPLIITKDAVDYFAASPRALLSRPETTFVLSFAQMQKMARSAKFPKAFTFSMDLMRLVDTLHEFTGQYSVNIVVKHLSNIIIASGGRVSTTKLDEDVEIWRVKTAARCAVWWLQNLNKAFESLTTAISNTITK